MLSVHTAWHAVGALQVLGHLVFSLTWSSTYCHSLKENKIKREILMVDVIYPLPLCRSSCIIICYTFNKVKLLNFTVSKNDQVLYPLIQWDSLFLLSDIMLWHWTSFITRGILFQKLNWYRQQDLMILSQCHSSTAEVTCTMLRVLGRARLSATPRSVAASFPFLWNCPGKDTGESCHLFLQGVFLTPGLNPCLSHLLHWQADSSPLCHLGSPESTCYTS